MRARIMEAMIFLLHRADAVGYIILLVNHMDVVLGTGEHQGGKDARLPSINDYQIGHAKILWYCC